MRYFLRARGAAAVATALMFAISGAGLASGAFAQGKGETIKIQDYPGVGNMLVRVAAKKGYCTNHGITCQLQMIPTGPLGAQALIAKSIDVGFFPTETQILAVTKGSGLKAIASGATLNTGIIVVHNDVAMPNLDKGFPAFMADLKGKKIGVGARGAATETLVHFLAVKAGMKPEDFTYVAVGAPNTAYGALMSKQVDANMTFEPSGSLCEVLKTCKVVYRAADHPLPTEVFAANGGATVMVVTQATIETSGHVVDAFLAALKDAEAFIQNPANFDETLVIAESFFKFDMPRGDEVMRASLKIAIPAYKTAITRPALQAIAANMLAMKQLEAPFDTSKIVYEKAP